MPRSLNLLLVFMPPLDVVAAVRAASTQPLRLSLPIGHLFPHLNPLWGSCGRARGDFKSYRMSSVGPNTSSKAEVAFRATMVPPVVHKSKIGFCPTCGNPTKLVIPDGEEKLRVVCTACGKIRYENPPMVVGCIVEHNDKVLLCKRKIEPSYGFWTLPTGFLEIGESAAEGTARETLEEACVDVEIISPFAHIDIPCIAQVR